MRIKEEGARKRGAAYAAASAILSILGLMGLPAGYYMGGSAAGKVIAGGAPILRGSLLGVLIEVLRGSIEPPPIDRIAGLAGYLPRLMYWAIPLLAGALCLSLFMTAAAIFRPDSARRLCLWNGRLLLLPYSALLLGNAFYCALRGAELSMRYLDLPSAAAAAAILLVLFLISLAENRGKSWAGALLLALSLVPVCALMIPSSLCVLLSRAALSAEPLTPFEVLLFTLFGIILLNLTLSVFRLNVKRMYLPDLARFGLQFLFTLGLAIVSAAAGGEIFEGGPLAVTLLLISPFCAFFLSLFTRSAHKKRARERMERLKEFPLPPDAEPAQAAQ